MPTTYILVSHTTFNNYPGRNPWINTGEGHTDVGHTGSALVYIGVMPWLNYQKTQIL